MYYYTPDGMQGERAPITGPGQRGRGGEVGFAQEFDDPFRWVFLREDKRVTNYPNWFPRL